MACSFIKEIYNPHEKYVTVNNDGPKKGCFIDIGYRNMGLRFSKYDGVKIEGIKHIKADYELSKGRKEARDILEGRPKVGIENNKFFSMIDHMNMLEEDLINCNYIVIEHQLDYIAKENTKVMNIFVGTLMTLVRDKGSLPIIILLDARSKTSLLGAKKLNKKDVKDWCYYKSLEILKYNIGTYDQELLRILPSLPKTGKNKRDEHGDIICYCYIWWKYMHEDFVEKYRE